MVGYSSWGRKESDMTEQLSMHTHTHTHTHSLFCILFYYGLSQAIEYIAVPCATQ